MGGRVGRTRMLMVVVLTVTCAALLAFTASSASAAKVHVYSHSFGAGLSLKAQSGIAINEETGEVYVADPGNSRIAKFTAAGAADGAFTGISSPTFIAVDNSTGPSKGDVYIVEGQATVTKLDPTGALVTSWGTAGHLSLSLTEEVVGIAVDAGGNLWAATQDLGHANPLGPDFGFVGVTVSGKEFDQSGAPVRSWGPNSLGNSTLERVAKAGIAVDSSDNIYYYQGSRAAEVGGTNINFAAKVSPTGQDLPSLQGFNTAGLASDPTNDDVYVGKLSASPAIVRYPSEFAGPIATKELERFGGDFEGPIVRPGSAKDGLENIASIAATKSGSIYVLDPKNGKVAVFELEEVEPPLATIEPPDSITSHSAHVVGHINPNAPTGSWPSHDVAWEFVCTPACPGHNGYIEVELDGSERSVEATLGGLDPGTEYSVLLVAKNRGGETEAPPNPNPGQPNPGEPFTTEAAPPAVVDKAPSELFRGEATFNATINSNGAETTYHFEYMTEVAYKVEGFEGTQTINTPESGPLPSSPAVRLVSSHVVGLQPGTDYVYRAVAQNSLGTGFGTPVVEFRSQVASNPIVTNCPNQALRTDAGMRLPDCRAYELVSPTDKLGSPVEPYPTGLQAAPDGSGVTWYTGQTATGIPSPQGAHPTYAFYLSSLVGEGWGSQRLLAPETPGRSASYLVGLTADARYALIETAADAKTFGEPALYLLDTATHLLTTIVPPQVGQKVGSRVFALDGGSTDDSWIFFESRLQLTSKAAPGKNNLYVWNRQTGVLALAGVLPGAQGEAPAGGSFGGAYFWWGNHPDLNLGGAEEALYVEPEHAISETGDTVYFTAGGTGQLYVRRGLTTAKPTTARVSVANSGVSDPNGSKAAAFQEATPNGSKAFFLSSGKLTQNANTGPADEGSDLYRYDAAAKTPLVDVSPLPGGAGARVQGLLGVSEDGRSGYLVAKGVLATKGVDGDSNLYHFQEKGGTFSYTFVTDLGSSSLTPTELHLIELNWSPLANEQKTARVSKDGGTVMFMSPRSLAGVPQSCIRSDCSQVYRYSMAEGVLACLSCNPTGEPAAFGAELGAVIGGLRPENRIRTKTESGEAISGILPTTMSASGTRIFFQTSASLLPEDRNGVNPEANCTSIRTCVDVYEWEAPRSPSDPTNTCDSTAQSGGCLYLLSSGEGGESSYFVNASADGSSAFVMTSSSLVPVDQDELADVYDARIDGGLGSQHVTEAEACSSSKTCKGASPAPPSPAPAGTSTFQGPGNPKYKECKKGFVLKHGKCVKKPAKHHNKKKHKKKSRPTGKKSSGGAN